MTLSWEGRGRRVVVMDIGGNWIFQTDFNGERGDNTVFEDSLRIGYNIFCTDQVFVIAGEKTERFRDVVVNPERCFNRKR